MWDKPLEDKCLSKQVWFQYNCVHIYIYSMYYLDLVWPQASDFHAAWGEVRRKFTNVASYLAYIAIFAKVVEKSHWTSLLNGRMASVLPSTRWYKDVSLRLAKLKKYSQAWKTMIWFHLWEVWMAYRFYPILELPKKHSTKPPNLCLNALSCQLMHRFHFPHLQLCTVWMQKGEYFHIP